MRRHTVRRLSIVLAALVIVPLLAIPPFAAAAPGEVTRVSVTSDGREVYGHSNDAVISPDGRYVAFQSWAVDLVPGDTNGVSDIFVHDRFTRVTESVSIALYGRVASGQSGAPAINSDGRFVAYGSAAANIVPNDTNDQLDVFVYDRQTGATQRVSVSSSGAEGNGGSYEPSISADGSLVTFSSEATNLTTGDTNNVADVFVHDLRTGMTERVSVSNAGQEADGFSENPSISADGRYVAFSSGSTNLASVEVFGPQIYLRDRELGTTTLISVSNLLEPIDSRSPIISADGNVVAFNRFGDVDRPMVRDLRANRTEYVDLANDGSMGDARGSVTSISADGRYVLFLSDATNLSEIDRDDVIDLFVRDRWLETTTLVSARPNGDPSGNWTFDGAISADGSVVVFSSMAENLVPADYNAHTDVFVREMGWQEPILIGDPAFQQTWEWTDQAVADGIVPRTWMWGPSPFTGVVQEPYAESTDRTRSVQYFDKARMERTYSDLAPGDPWATTNGLLVVELVSGRLQIGNEQFITRGPARVNIAGDPDDPDGPTYATFGTLVDDPPLDEGSVIVQRVDRTGTLMSDPALAAWGVQAGTLVPETGHRVASVFWDFLHSRGTVLVDGEYRDAQLFEPWYYASGLPISEAYWTTVRVAGTPREVLVQAFERRVLTYTPDNPFGWQVEAGNVGQHYYRWRQGLLLGTCDGEDEMQICTMRPDGSERVVVYRYGDALSELDWSPDGARIAFIRGAGLYGVLSVVDVDGSGFRTLSEGYPDRDIHWSPDGTMIAYVSGRGYAQGKPEPAYNDVYVVSADGSQTWRVTTTHDHNRILSWTPNSAALVIGSDMDTDDNGLTDVKMTTLSGVVEGSMDGMTGLIWSPDNRHYAYTTREHGNEDIYSSMEEYGNLGRLTESPGDDQLISWSPDGSQILFRSNREGEWNLYVMQADGSNETSVSHAQASEGDWSPDGARITYQTWAGTGDGGAWTVAPDGTDRRPVPLSVGVDWSP